MCMSCIQVYSMPPMATEHDDACTVAATCIFDHTCARAHVLHTCAHVKMHMHGISTNAHAHACMHAPCACMCTRACDMCTCAWRVCVCVCVCVCGKKDATDMCVCV